MRLTPVQRRFRAVIRKPGPKWQLPALALATFAGVVAIGLSAPVLARLDLGKIGRRIEYQSIRVIDGDTIAMANGERVRILNIDAPEMPPHSRCGEEERLAYASRDRLRRMIRGASDITLRFGYDGRDHDVYGRSLRYLVVDGADAGEVLMREGLAQPWRGHHAVWC